MLQDSFPFLSDAEEYLHCDWMVLNGGGTSYELMALPVGNSLFAIYGYMIIWICMVRLFLFGQSAFLCCMDKPLI